MRAVAALPVRRGFAAAAAITLVLAGGAACSKDKNDWNGQGSKGDGDKKAAVELAVTPAEAATDVPVSAEIEVKATGGKVSEVTLADPTGAAVAGAMRADGTSWVPTSPLKYTTQYKAVVKAADDKGKTAEKTINFTTMARPGNRMGAQVFMSDNITTYGQAMPIVVEFRNGGVKGKDQKAIVEKRLFVTSEPAQEGIWHWDSDIQVEYRPKEYWQAGTKLKVRLGLGGLPLGDGRYGETDITINAGIDKVRRAIEVDNATKQLVATQDGNVVKQMPVSLGKTANPSMSGTMVIIERLEKTVFDSSTYGVPSNSADGYRTDIQFAERLTWSGQFIHAAPWSVEDQGKRNVSHGCVNISLDNATWIYQWTRVGDPVIVKGTEEKLPGGDGWTAWNLSWEEFQKGSALLKAGTPGSGNGPGPSTSPS
jgi:lipoprotein-anchoring transpeptidase ErfK/SrfK